MRAFTIIMRLIIAIFAITFMLSEGVENLVTTKVPWLIIFKSVNFSVVLVTLFALVYFYGVATLSLWRIDHGEGDYGDYKTENHKINKALKGAITWVSISAISICVFNLYFLFNFVVV